MEVFRRHPCFASIAFASGAARPATRLTGAEPPAISVVTLLVEDCPCAVRGQKDPSWDMGLAFAEAEAVVFSCNDEESIAQSLRPTPGSDKLQSRHKHNVPLILNLSFPSVFLSRLCRRKVMCFSRPAGTLSHGAQRYLATCGT